MLRFIDLFAGIGGIRLPFEELGLDCVFSSEIDKFACQTYFENFNETPSGDITKIDTADIPDFDILLAGFPCQPFSQAGKQLGFADTRGTMFFEIERILKDKRPAAFLLENVKALETHDHGRTLQTIISRLRNLGYSVSYRIYSAKDFGVPQNRERIYITGYYSQPPFDFPDPEYQETKLADILETEVPEKYTLSDKLWSGTVRRKEEHRKKGNGFGYSLFNPDAPYVNTLTARYYKDGSEILIKQDGRNPRKLTPRECARLQGFPDTFKIPVSDTQAYKQFGNSVAVPVIRAIANKMVYDLCQNSINI
jgi:DNA (cytosine-5)-methyltransferase 1